VTQSAQQSSRSRLRPTSRLCRPRRTARCSPKHQSSSPMPAIIPYSRHWRPGAPRQRADGPRSKTTPSRVLRIGVGVPRSMKATPHQRAAVISDISGEPALCIRGAPFRDQSRIGVANVPSAAGQATDLLDGARPRILQLHPCHQPASRSPSWTAPPPRNPVALRASCDPLEGRLAAAGARHRDRALAGRGAACRARGASALSSPPAPDPDPAGPTLASSRSQELSRPTAPFGGCKRSQGIATRSGTDCIDQCGEAITGMVGGPPLKGPPGCPTTSIPRGSCS
jgi:hypothetical protein